MQSNSEILTTVYAAFNRRDIDGVFAHMRSDVDWPNGMEGGRVHGLEEVRAYWTRQWNLLNPRVDPVGIRDQGDGRTIVEVHQVVRDLAGNLLIDHMVQHIYSIQNGLIARMDIREVE